MKKLNAMAICGILILLLLGCSINETAPQNPYRPVSYKNEVFEDGVMTEWILEEYQYDENGFQTGSRHYLYGILEETYIYENDAFGNILKVTKMSDDKTTVFDHKLTLDDHGRVLLEESYLDGVLCYTLEYTYDKNGNLTSEIYTTIENGIADAVRNKEMTYNRKGELIQEIRYQKDGSYIQHDYEDGKETNAYH